jgi:hypothetical protein
MATLLLRHALCAGVPDGGEDSCRSDSAVPLSIGEAQVVRTGTGTLKTALS